MQIFRIYITTLNWKHLRDSTLHTKQQTKACCVQTLHRAQVNKECTSIQVNFHLLRTHRWEYLQLSSTTRSSFPLFNQPVHLKRISLFWDFNPVSELISETEGLEEGNGRGDQSHSASALLSQLHPQGIRATNKSHSHNASRKINFLRLGARSCRSESCFGWFPGISQSDRNMDENKCEWWSDCV